MVDLSVRLVCGNCGKIEKLASFDAAEEAGWDTPLVYGYTACPDCLGVSVYFPLLYCQYAKAATDPKVRDGYIAKAAACTRGEFR